TNFYGPNDVVGRAIKMPEVKEWHGGYLIGGFGGVKYRAWAPFTLSGEIGGGWNGFFNHEAIPREVSGATTTYKFNKKMGVTFSCSLLPEVEIAPKVSCFGRIGWAIHRYQTLNEAGPYAPSGVLATWMNGLLGGGGITLKPSTLWHLRGEYQCQWLPRCYRVGAIYPENMVGTAAGPVTGKTRYWANQYVIALIHPL
ncbi:MAG: hypothetical protein VXZ72_04785, partial [Chlamydiota bacterium]|nr:hypothetical protein [Chlamydiota bacterium]